MKQESRKGIDSQEEDRRASPLTYSLLVATCSFLLYALLRSRDFTTVDGATRCVEIFYRQRLFFHENNHLLYPVNVLLWQKLLGLIGIHASDPIEYLALTQLMNAAAAGLCLGIMYILLWIATVSHRVALTGVTLIGLSRAFLLHATNSAEPMAGLLWSLAGILLVVEARRRNHVVLAFGGGALFALALATYQSMILLAPAAGLLCLAGNPRKRYLYLLALVVGSACGIASIYGFAYHWIGVEPEDMSVKFFQLSGASVYGGFSARKWALLPVGLTSSLLDVIPGDFTGFRSLLRLHSRDFTLPFLGVALATVICWSILAARRLAKAWGPLSAQIRLAVVSAIAALLVTCIAPAFWEPLYDKLWLQPLLAWHSLILLALSTPLASTASTFQRVITLLGVTFLATNIVTAVSDHRQPTPHLQEAARVAEIVTPPDLLVHDWDEISVLYGTIWGSSPQRHRFDLPTSATQLGSRTPELLNQKIGETLARGGRVYFLGILDQLPEQWDAFLGSRTGLPFSTLDRYRNSRVIRRFLYGTDAWITLRLWRPPEPFRRAKNSLR